MKTFKLYARAISYTRPYLHYIAISVVLSLLIVSAESLSLWFSASLVNTLFLPGSTAPLKPTFSINHINEWLKFWTYSIIQRENVFTSLKIVCVLMLGSFFFKNVLSYFKSLLIAKINIFIIRDMRNQIFSHIVNLPVTYYDRNKSGQITSLILNDASAVNNSLVSTFDKLLIEPLRIIFFITMLLVISSKLTIIIASIFPILAYLILEMGKTIRRRSKRNLERFEGMTSVVQETASCIRAVKMFNMALFETDKFKRENDRLNHATFRSILFITLSGPLTETLGVIVTVILLFFGGMEVLKGHSISAEDFVRYLTFLFITFQPFKSLAGVNSTLQGGLAAAQRIFGLLDVQAEPVSISAHERVPSFEKEIKFSEVRFTYPGTAQEVIRGINFTVKKNQIVAIVGSSGSGKSTILDLLPRFYDIQEGSISIDGKDIRENDLLGLRSLFGIVSQETVLFNDSVFNNIGYGLQGASAALVIEAAKLPMHGNSLKNFLKALKRS